jgi:glycerate kinase
MKILIAPDSFKGSLTAREAAAAISDGVMTVYPTAKVIELPVADGGEGTVDALVRATSGRFLESEVSGPMPYQRVRATWGLIEYDKTAVIEMAAAAGLNLVESQKRDPKITTTYGVGELIRAALDVGVRKIIVGLGGSATNDGGAGMAQALGVGLLAVDGHELAPGGASLLSLARIDMSNADKRTYNVEIVAATDVTNTLCGPTGASCIYGPQKGATREDVKLLDEALWHYAEIIQSYLATDVLSLPRGGAAGGLGAGLAAFCRARLENGIDIVLDTVKFDEKLESVDLVITGEGKIDEQTIFGKAVKGVTERARRKNVPAIAIGGIVEGDKDQLTNDLQLVGIFSIKNNSTSKGEAMTRAKELLRERTIDALSEIRTQM